MEVWEFLVSEIRVSYCLISQKSKSMSLAAIVFVFFFSVTSLCYCSS